MNKYLASVTYVSDHADFVSINRAAIKKYIAAFRPTPMDHWIKACPFAYHPLANIEDEIDRWFLADAMAFCFWGYPDKWTVMYQNQNIDGWWALLATFQRALESNIPLLDGSFLANLSFEEAGELFAGTPPIPLLDERIEILHTIGHTLTSQYDGRFHNFLKNAPVDAMQFIKALAREFPVFDDVSVYKGEKIYFYKKAQLFVHDLMTAFPDYPYKRLNGLSQLTGKADYKIPARLRDLGILVYSSSLSEKVDARVELPADSPEEIEIRACMLVACDLICHALAERDIRLDPVTLDGILWVQSQTKREGVKPYHLTRTTDY